MEIKICGITHQNEALYLNEAGADYAGFVFFEKSKRNVSIAQAKEIMSVLDEHIRAVAVTVSPDIELLKGITEAGFSILQVHGELSREILEAAEIPIWYAVNIAKEDEFAIRASFLQVLPGKLADKVQAIVVDGAEYGSGKTFDWKKSKSLNKSFFDGRLFILAGGLNPENVREGIEIFEPDAVDVSSGVEFKDTTAIPPGKDKKLIFDFIRKARGYE
jgi:phosphoribosylanthranilate isomerase